MGNSAQYSNWTVSIANKQGGHAGWAAPNWNNQATTMVASSPPGEQIMTTIKEPIYQTPSATKSTLELTVKFYEWSVFRASRSSPEAPLNYSEHPFFIDIPNVPQDKKDFFYKVFAKEGEIFKGCIIEWEPVKELVLREWGWAGARIVCRLNVLEEVIS